MGEEKKIKYKKKRVTSCKENVVKVQKRKKEKEKGGEMLIVEGHHDDACLLKLRRPMPDLKL